eukprot:1144372_1
MTSDAKQAIVIGAGIVGVCTAYELSKHGYDVTVIERFPLAGQFTSMANAGVVRPHSKTPFKSQASRSTLSTIILALKSLSPTFQINYSTNVVMDPYFFNDITSYKWIYAFLKSRFNRTDSDTLHHYDTLCVNAMISNTNEILSATGYDFQSNTGYVNIFPSSFATNTRKPINIYNALSQIHPSELNQLAKTSQQKEIKDLKIETYHSFAGDCHKFCNLISNNIKFRFNTEATQILVDKDNKVCSVRLDDNTILKADTVVICAGILTNNMIQNKVYQMTNNNKEPKRVQLPYVPIIPLQGFSISVPYSDARDYKYPFGTMVYHPSRIYASRVNDHLLRFSAYGYFRSVKDATKQWNMLQETTEGKEGVQSNVNNISKTEQALWDNMENCVKDNLLSVYDMDKEYFDEHKIKWSGFRPYTPDALPIVGQVGNVNGLYVNAGHGLYGWKASHGTAKLLTNLIEQSNDDNEKDILKCLSLDRFQ